MLAELGQKIGYLVYLVLKWLSVLGKIKYSQQSTRQSGTSLARLATNWLFQTAQRKRWICHTVKKRRKTTWQNCLAGGLAPTRITQTYGVVAYQRRVYQPYGLIVHLPATTEQRTAGLLRRTAKMSKTTLQVGEIYIPLKTLATYFSASL